MHLYIFILIFSPHRARALRVFSSPSPRSAKDHRGLSGGGARLAHQIQPAEKHTVDFILTRCDGREQDPFFDFMTLPPDCICALHGVGGRNHFVVGAATRRNAEHRPLPDDFFAFFEEFPLRGEQKPVLCLRAWNEYVRKRERASSSVAGSAARDNSNLTVNGVANSKVRLKSGESDVGSVGHSKMPRSKSSRLSGADAVGDELVSSGRLWSQAEWRMLLVCDMIRKKIDLSGEQVWMIFQMLSGTVRSEAAVRSKIQDCSWTPIGVVDQLAPIADAAVKSLDLLLERAAAWVVLQTKGHADDRIREFFLAETLGTHVQKDLLRYLCSFVSREGLSDASSRPRGPVFLFVFFLEVVRNSLVAANARRYSDAVAMFLRSLVAVGGTGALRLLRGGWTMRFGYNFVLPHPKTVDRRSKELFPFDEEFREPRLCVGALRYHLGLLRDSNVKFVELRCDLREISQRMSSRGKKIFGIPNLWGTSFRLITGCELSQTAEEWERYLLCAVEATTASELLVHIKDFGIILANCDKVLKAAEDAACGSKSRADDSVTQHHVGVESSSGQVRSPSDGHVRVVVGEESGPFAVEGPLEESPETDDDNGSGDERISAHDEELASGVVPSVAPRVAGVVGLSSVALRRAEIRDLMIAARNLEGAVRAAGEGSLDAGVQLDAEKFFRDCIPTICEPATRMGVFTLQPVQGGLSAVVGYFLTSGLSRARFEALVSAVLGAVNEAREADPSLPAVQLLATDGEFLGMENSPVVGGGETRLAALRRLRRQAACEPNDDIFRGSFVIVNAVREINGGETPLQTIKYVEDQLTVMLSSDMTVVHDFVAIVKRRIDSRKKELRSGESQKIRAKLGEPPVLRRAQDIFAMWQFLLLAVDSTFSLHYYVKNNDAGPMYVQCGTHLIRRVWKSFCTVFKDLLSDLVAERVIGAGIAANQDKQNTSWALACFSEQVESAMRARNAHQVRALHVHVLCSVPRFHFTQDGRPPTLRAS